MLASDTHPMGASEWPSYASCSFWACRLIWLAYAVRQFRKAHNGLVERVRRLESRVFSGTIPGRKLTEA